VLVTKYRKKCLNDTVLQKTKEISEKLCNDYDIELLEFGGEADHVHLLMSLHPNIMPSKFINSLKTVTSRLLRKEFSEHFRKFYWKPVLWTRAYCLISTGGATIETIRKYIENQGSDSSPPKS
jgi:putative transposase